MRRCIGIGLCAVVALGCGAPQRAALGPDPVVLAPGEALRLPSIRPDTRDAGILHVQFRFRFEGRERRLAVEVDQAVLAAARRTDKRAWRRAEAVDLDWASPWYRAFAEDPAQRPLLQALVSAFQAMRAREGLDADRYVELISAWVRSLPYHTDPDAPMPRFPIETVADGSGDCDDKSLLLGALLAVEGYDVALLRFEAEDHMALGVRATQASWPGTGYALVETTGASYVGLPLGTLRGGVVLASRPSEVRLGSGGASYGAGADVERLRAALSQLEGRRKVLEAAIAARNAHCDASRRELDRLRAELDRLQARGDATAYNREVPAFNRAVSTYNACVNAHNEDVRRLNAGIALERAILEGSDDRAGVVRRVRAELGP